MGLTTITDELEDLITKHKPTLVILTETKLTSMQEDRKMVRVAFQDEYVLHYSSNSQNLRDPNGTISNDDRMRAGSGGVILAVHKKWADVCSIERHIYHNRPHMRGHAIGLTLHAKDSLAI